MNVGSCGDGHGRRSGELLTESELLVCDLVVTSLSHHDSSALDVWSAELVRLCHGSASVRRGGRQSSATKDRQERLAEVGVHPAVEERVDSAGTHRHDAKHQVDEPEVGTTDALPVELADDREQLVRSPGHGEHQYHSGQHPVSARHSAPTACLLPTGPDVSEHQQIENADHEQWQEVLDNERHYCVQLADFTRRPSLFARASTEAQFGVGKDDVAREYCHWQRDDGGEGGDDEDKNDGDGRRQTPLDADNYERKPINSYDCQRQRAGVDNDSKHSRNDVAQCRAERPVLRYL